MTHIFILNPMAGSGERIDEVREKIAGMDNCALYETTKPKDATAYIRNYCETHTDKVRFYACGGDGTAKEVAEGILGFENAEMTCYPIGSGNDFVKYFGGAERFSDIDALISAEARPIDIIKVGNEYSVNVCNFGFDSCVAETMSIVKRKPIIGGKHAYTTGIFNALIHAMKNYGEVYADGRKLNEKVFLLCTVSNGGYVGGSFNCAPYADTSDGLAEICLVKPISLFTFLRLLDSYKKGTHLTDKRFRNILTYTRAKHIEAVSPKPFWISLDGEMVKTDRLVADMIPGALKFAVPADRESAKSGEKVPQEAV